jgi:hypothetical protein
MKMDFVPYIESLFPAMLMGITGANMCQPSWISWEDEHQSQLCNSYVLMKARAFHDLAHPQCAAKGGPFFL